MSLIDMVRVCTLSSAAIVTLMLLLGFMMVAHKPQTGLILAAHSPTVQPAHTKPLAAEPTPQPVRVATSGVAASL